MRSLMKCNGCGFTGSSEFFTEEHEVACTHCGSNDVTQITPENVAQLISQEKQELILEILTSPL